MLKFIAMMVSRSTDSSATHRLKIHHGVRWLVAATTVSCFMAEAFAQDADGAEMVVTATGIERQVFETPHAVSVLDDQTVAESGMAKTPDILAGTEGVLVQKTNAGGGSPFLRGLTGKQVLILVDGIRLNNAYYRFGPHQYLNTIDANTIERIEVVRGPASVLYGSDALGGVINVITKRRSEFSRPLALGGLLQLQGRTADEQLSARVQIEGNRGALGFIGGISAKQFGELRGGHGVGVQSPTGYDEINADLKLNYRLAAGSELILAHQFSRQYDVPKTSEVTLGNKFKFNYEPQLRALSYLEYRAANVGVLDELRLNVSYNRQQEGEEIIARAAPKIETRELTDVRTIGLRTDASSRIGSRHLLSYGFDYYRDRFATRNTRLDLNSGASTAIAPGTPDGARYSAAGVFVQDTLSLTPRFEATLGGRYSRFSADGSLSGTQLAFSGSKFTGSAYGLLRLTPRWNLVGGIAQGYRAPNMEDFFGRVDFVSEIPNTALRPERSLNREIGLKYYSAQTSGDIFLYAADYDDLIARVDVAPGVKQRQNLRKATIGGIESGIKHAFDRYWSAAANLAYARGEDRDSGQPLQRIPPLNGALRLRFDRSAKDWYELYSLFAAKQKRLSPEDLGDARIPRGGTPGYATLNLRAGFAPSRNQQWLLSLENIGNLKYKSHGSGIYAPGTNLSVTWRWNMD